MTNDWLGNYDETLPDKVKAADFAYWSRTPNWDKKVAVALALGAEPLSAFDYAEGGYRSYHSGGNYKKPNFVIAYELLNHLVYANFRSGLYNDVSVKPTHFVDWLERSRLPCPNELKTALAEFGTTSKDWHAISVALQNQNKELVARVATLERALADTIVAGSSSTKEKESLLKIAIGLAVKGYGFDPKSSRSPTAKEISDDLIALGISLSDDTVRKYLKEAAELLPPQDRA